MVRGLIFIRQSSSSGGRHDPLGIAVILRSAPRDPSLRAEPVAPTEESGAATVRPVERVPFLF
jgi:hypothetical protein